MKPQPKKQIVAERSEIDGDITVSIGTIAALEWAKKELPKFSDDGIAKHFLKEANEVPYRVRSMHISTCYDLDEVIDYFNSTQLEDVNVLSMASIQVGRLTN